MKATIMIAALLGMAGCRQAEQPDLGARPAEKGSAEPGQAAGQVDRDAAHRVAPPPSGRVSQYRSLGKDNCKLVEESAEGPYWRMRCGGVGGFAVDYTESDLRQNILVIAPDGVATSLDLPSRVANGAFDRLGSTIEWRGPAGEAPDMLVVRVHVANDQGEDDSGRLAVARLRPEPCLVGIVDPQRGQSDLARALADRGAPCL